MSRQLKISQEAQLYPNIAYKWNCFLGNSYRLLHFAWDSHLSIRCIQLSSVQSLSSVWLVAIPWVIACQASLSITNSQSSLKHMSIESVMTSSHLILCCPLLHLPLIPPRIRVLSNESTLCMSILTHKSLKLQVIELRSWFCRTNEMMLLTTLFKRWGYGPPNGHF